MKNVVLNNGVEIPEIGLGTWLIGNDYIYDIFNKAIKAGYTHFDSAQDYGNEENLGKAIQESGIERSKLFITTKIAARHKSYKSAKKSLDESFKKLGLDYIDLVLIHCPQPWIIYNISPFRYHKGNLEVWRLMEEYYKAGKIKAIGISNFNIKDTKNILKHCTVKPMVNQIPVFIGNTNWKLINFCKENDIVVEAYSPIAHGRALKNGYIQKIAEKCGVSVAKLCIAYTLQIGTVTLPKTMSYDHMVDNLKTDFVIPEDVLEELKNK